MNQKEIEKEKKIKEDRKELKNLLGDLFSDDRKKIIMDERKLIAKDIREFFNKRYKRYSYYKEFVRTDVEELVIKIRRGA